MTSSSSRRKTGILTPFLWLCALPVFASAHVTLPDSSAYTYWVQTATGTVAQQPVNVQGHAQITLPASASSGTLFVLDHHDGEIASLPITGQNLTLAVSDFKPLGAAPAATPAASPAPAKPIAASPAAVPQTSGIARLFTLIFGLLVAAGVGWFLMRLIQSRGQPLIDAARRIGVDVPDPTDMTDEQPAPVYTPPTPRAVDKIPDEAGAAPAPILSAPRLAATGTLESPQIVGIQGLAAGSVFALPVGEMYIGRDGDNGIVLAESTVSRRHACLSRSRDGQVKLSDAGSANGVYVNGQRVTEAVITPGDLIQIGDNSFRLEA